MTPLHLAAWFSSAAVVRTQSDAGSYVDALDSDQNSPLHWASWKNPAVLPVLIGAGCKVNLLNEFWCSPLFLAASIGKDRSAVATLMSAAADPHLGKGPIFPLTHHSISSEMKDYIRGLSE